MFFWEQEGLGMSAKKYTQPKSWEFCFIPWEFLGLQAQGAASQVTLRELLRGDEGGPNIYRSFIIVLL